jgi:sugar phosphate permease
MPRVLIATVAGLAGFVAYVAAAVVLADGVTRMHWAVQALYFLAAGLLWTLPARWLMLWAARPRGLRRPRPPMGGSTA